MMIDNFLNSNTTNDINLPKEEYVIVNAIQIPSQCKADPIVIIREVLLEAVLLEQPVDWDKDTPLAPLLTLLRKGYSGDYIGAHAEVSNIFPKGSIGYANADDETGDNDENDMFVIHLRQAIALLISQGTSYQIIYDSLLQAVFDYGVSISENSRVLTNLLLIAVKDVFMIIADYEWEQEELEEQEKFIL
jgi:hypothetical protein